MARGEEASTGSYRHLGERLLRQHIGGADEASTVENGRIGVERRPYGSAAPQAQLPLNEESLLGRLFFSKQNAVS